MEDMKIQNITDNKELAKEGNNFVLQFGTLLEGTDNTKKLRFTDVDSKNISFTITCSCTKITNKTVVDSRTLDIDISVVTSGIYVKTAEIRENGKLELLKLKGEFK